MIDFKELTKDGTDLERLAREIFVREGYETHWTGKGADGGRDQIVKEKLIGPLSEFERIWLVQCKHKAHSGESAGKDESHPIITDCQRIKATGYLMICTTQPSSGLINAYQELQSQKLVIKYWDSVILESVLLKPCNFPLLHSFFPNSSKAIGWKIYNTNSPSFWAANYKHSFFYLASRLSMNFKSFKTVELIYEIMENVSRKAKMIIELRGIYYDDKYSSYKIFIDYMIDKKSIDNPFDIYNLLKDNLKGMLDLGEGYIPILWDVIGRTVNSSNDSFDSQSQEYYEPYINNFKTGAERPGASIFEY